MRSELVTLTIAHSVAHIILNALLIFCRASLIHNTHVYVGLLDNGPSWTLNWFRRSRSERTSSMMGLYVTHSHPLSKSAEIISWQSLRQGVSELKLGCYLLVHEDAFFVFLVKEGHLESVMFTPLGLLTAVA